MTGVHKVGKSGHGQTHPLTHTDWSSGAGVNPDGFISRLWQTDAPTETITSCLPFGLQKQHEYYRLPVKRDVLLEHGLILLLFLPLPNHHSHDNFPLLLGEVTEVR